MTLQAAPPRSSTLEWLWAAAAAIIGVGVGVAAGLDGGGGIAAAVVGIGFAIAAGVVDAREHRIPNALIIRLAPFIGGFLIGGSIAGGELLRLGWTLGAGIAALALYAALWALGAIGGGDAKLAPILIAHAAAYGTIPALLAAALPMALALPHAVIAKRRGTSVPLGPYLAAGYAIALGVALIGGPL